MSVPAYCKTVPVTSGQWKERGVGDIKLLKHRATGNVRFVACTKLLYAMCVCLRIAKLFQFTSGEWKERGVGDMKLLKHRATGKVRLLLVHYYFMPCVCACVLQNCSSSLVDSGKSAVWGTSSC